MDWIAAGKDWIAARCGMGEGDGSSHCVRAIMLFMAVETGLRADFYTFNLIFGEFFVYLRAL